MTWAIYEHEGEQHVIPRRDDRLHTWTGCACRPEPNEEQPSVIVHNSFDGREAFETGERLPS